MLIPTERFIASVVVNPLLPSISTGAPPLNLCEIVSRELSLYKGVTGQIVRLDYTSFIQTHHA